MKHLWLLYFPLLFLPNLGFEIPTAFGTVEFSDLLIGPYIVLLLFAINWGEKLNIGQLTPLFMIFVGWALISTLTISIRYGYADDFQVEFGVLKLAKFGLYGVAGILTARALTASKTRLAFNWSLLGAAIVCGLSLFLTRVNPSVQTKVDAGSGYSATNGISVMVAILLCYLAAKLVTNQGTKFWRMVAPIGLLLVVAGFTVSDGRGGWLAAIVGCLYIVFRLGPSRQIIMYGFVGVMVVTLLYNTQPSFKDEIDKTIFLPNDVTTYQGTRNVGTLDDGGRFETWSIEAQKLVHAPVLGTGLYHRGGASGLFSTGSHNFFLQMFLELGVVGGILTISIIVKMWKQATRVRVLERTADVPMKAALIAAIVGGLGGEYFYGGIILFTLLAVYAQTGGLAIDQRRQVLQPARQRTASVWPRQEPVIGRSRTS